MWVQFTLLKTKCRKAYLTLTPGGAELGLTRVGTWWAVGAVRGRQRPAGPTGGGRHTGRGSAECALPRAQPLQPPGGRPRGRAALATR